MNNNPFQLTFTLKQHTPLIHFQHYQDGATLRATEVKAKLDKFLIKTLKLSQKVNDDGKEKTAPKTEYRSWFNDVEHLSLDYKIRIWAEGRNKQQLDLKQPIIKGDKKIYNTVPFPLLIANMGGKESERELKNFSFYDGIHITITTGVRDLRNAVESHLPDFFILHNFGNRQNKGFGSFTVAQNSPNDKLQLIRKYKDPVWYWKYNSEQSIKTIFSDISTVYALLKTGINFPDHPTIPGRNQIDYNIKGAYKFYHRSFLFNYSKRYNYGNEKRFIKENFFDPSKRLPNDGLPKKYVRAVLGTSSFHEYKGKDRNGRINISSTDIERYASPITFKVFDDKVCYFVEDNSATQSILGKQFVFQEAGRNHELSIETPDNFNFPVLIEMLSEFKEYFNALVYGVNDHLFEMYKSRDGRLPPTLADLIDKLNNIEILSL